MKIITAVFINLFICTQSIAGVIYNESINGDSNLWWNGGGANIGAVLSGDEILGLTHKLPAPDWDGYKFTLDGTLDVISIEALGGTFGTNSWQLYIGNTELENSIPINTIGQIVTLDISGLIGEFSIGNNYMGGNLAYTYNILFTHFIDPSDPLPIPEPSILALMGLGIFGLGISRRRKIQG